MARFCPGSGLLFQHIPRTGGTWVEEALKVLRIRSNRWLEKQPAYLPRKHALQSQYFLDGSMQQVKHVAIFVRHPVGLYESVWKYLVDAGPRFRSNLFRRRNRRHGIGEKKFTIRMRWHPKFAAARAYDDNFSTWVRRMLLEYPQWYTRLLDVYLGPAGGEWCTFIGRTETLEDDLLTVLREYGYGKKIDRNRHSLENIERTNKITGRTVWDLGLKDLLLYAEREVLNRFYEGDGKDRRWYDERWRV